MSIFFWPFPLIIKKIIIMTILNLLVVQNSQQVRLDLKVTFGESFLVGKEMPCCLK